ncbi:MAG: hypothetical protein BWY70_01133 [Bacteroidetes bacterium ADurb.Bin408]|nr:MAG: hypothetical protein BWY70_01133 [Bacteroidetes bacterium ADurb.Bin408]
MLSRRQVRIKVLHALYAYQQTDKADLHAGQQELNRSIDKFFDLFYFQLMLLPEIVDVAARLIEEGKQKRVPAPEDLNPQMNFVNNSLLKGLLENKNLAKICQRRTINWTINQDIPRRIFKKFRMSPVYKSYMQLQSPTFEQDKAVILKLLKKFIYTHRALYDFYEENSLYWINDFDQVTFILIKILMSLKESNVSTYRFIDNYDNELQEEVFFANNLFQKTILHFDEYNNIISGYTQNWEMERVALMDNLIMKMAVCEFMEFSSVPVKVTLNEYIEIAKIYSTPKSNIFINGVLDKLVDDYKKSGKIKKIGRGLIDN